MRRLLAIFALILMLSLLLCSCDALNTDPFASTAAQTTVAATTTTVATSAATTQSTTKKDPPQSTEIDLSDANIEDFELSESETDYVLISVANYGDILIRLFPDVAPITVNNFKKLVSEGFYDGLIFHRVIENFMIQGGGYTEDFYEKRTSSIKGEFASNGVENNLAHVSGVISMARTSVKNSATSQFFIVHKTSPHLDGEYAAFGYAADGRDVVDAIAKCSKGSNNIPSQTIVITSARFVKAKVDI